MDLFADRTDSHLRPVLRPRSDLAGSPLRPLGAVPVFSNAGNSDVVCHFRGSITRLGACCVRFMPSSPMTMQHSLPVGGFRQRRISLTAETFTGPAFAEWVPTEWFHLPLPINSSLPELRLARSSPDPYRPLVCCPVSAISRGILTRLSPKMSLTHMFQVRTDPFDIAGCSNLIEQPR